MPIAPYDSAAGGPSQAAGLATTQYTNNLTDAANSTDKMTAQGRLTEQYKDVTQPGLESSLGSAGQFYSTAARKSEGQAQLGYTNQMADLETAFNRAHMDLKRQEAFAAIGLIL